MRSPAYKGYSVYRFGTWESLTILEGTLSSRKIGYDGLAVRTKLEFEIGPFQAEALADFAGTFGMTLNRAAQVILSEYLANAGYMVEIESYDVQQEVTKHHA